MIEVHHTKLSSSASIGSSCFNSVLEVLHVSQVNVRRLNSRFLSVVGICQWIESGRCISSMDRLHQGLSGPVRTMN